MSEQIVYTGKGVVYYYDAGKKNWTESAIKGYSRLDIYKNPATGGYRVIGRGYEDTKTVVINSMITKETAYVRTKENFHQFQDTRYLYGLNFASKNDADAFGEQFEITVTALKGGSAAIPPTKPLPATAPKAPAPAPNAPKAPGPPPPPKAPAPPPKAPATTKSDVPPSSAERSNLLGSIQDFSVKNLKKAATVDKSGPALAPVPQNTASHASDTNESDHSAPVSKGAPASAGAGGDMMAQIMAKRAAMHPRKESTGSNIPVEKTTLEKKPPVPHKPPTVKPEPVSKPPVPVRNPSTYSLHPTAAAPSSNTHEPLSSNSGSSNSSNQSDGPVLPDHLQQLKAELMAEFRLELAKFKEEISIMLQNR